MPRLDKTGPLGNGPMTGRGLGFCNGGCGFGGNFRCGRNFRQRPWTKEEELKALENEEKALQEEIEKVKEDITDLKNQK